MKPAAAEYGNALAGKQANKPRSKQTCTTTTNKQTIRCWLIVVVCLFVCSFVHSCVGSFAFIILTHWAYDVDTQLSLEHALPERNLHLIKSPSFVSSLQPRACSNSLRTALLRTVVLGRVNFEHRVFALMCVGLT